MLKKILLSVLAIFGFTFFLSSNSYAVSDVTYTLTSNSNSVNFCNNNNPDIANCSDYPYIKFSPSDTSLTNTFYIYTQPTPSNQIPYKNVFGDLVFSLDNFDVVYFSQSLSFLGNSTITVTLTTNPFSSGIVPEGSLSITSNGTYDVTNYASAVVDVSTTNTWVVELFKDGFWGIMTALVALIVPVLVLFLVFRLVHDWLWGKG